MITMRLLCFYAFSDEDAGRLTQHHNTNFVDDTPTMIAHNAIPEPIFTGERNQQTICTQNTLKFVR